MKYLCGCIAVVMLVVSMLCSRPCFAYSSAQMERYVENTPRRNENQLLTLVRYLTRPFHNDYDKAEAIAFWISSHIVYDKYLYNNGHTTKLRTAYQGQTPQELLQSRVGICGDFSALFLEMCQKAGISAGYVTGYAYAADKRLTPSLQANSGHMWNYFVYNNRKIYVDTTFMAQGVAEVNGMINGFNHKRTLRNIKQENRLHSNTHPIDDFYFDFTYADEVKQRQYRRTETR